MYKQANLIMSNDKIKRVKTSISIQASLIILIFCLSNVYNFIGMSILLIGQRSRQSHRVRPLHHSPFYSQQLMSQKRQQQQKYRKQLLAQIREAQERKRIERQKNKQLDAKYQRQFYEQLQQFHKAHRERIDFLSNKKFSAPPDNLINRNVDNLPSQSNSRFKSRKGHQRALTLPPLDEETNHKHKNNRYHTQGTYGLFKNSRLKTQSHEHKCHFQQPKRQQHSDHTQLQSAEKRQKELHDELQYKLNQVYDLMNESSKICNNKQELQQISSQLRPIRLHFQKGYKVRYPEPSYYHHPNFSSSNPEQQLPSSPSRDYYKLPNITRSFNQNQHLNQRQSEEDWRQWYANQKMKELEAKYRKQLNIEKSDISFRKAEDNHRLRTPFNQFLT